MIQEPQPEISKETEDQRFLGQTWSHALSTNRLVPKWDRVLGETLEICLPASLKRALTHFATFVRQQSNWRETQGHIPNGWEELCALRSSGHYLYAPRWTFPLFYFGGPHGRLFKGLFGLDVGARVSRRSDPLKAGPLKFATENPMLQESFRPHWLHYEQLGASMRAIDMIEDASEPRIEVGDARLLRLPSASFDFVTVPMLFGPGNPCSTVLDYRVFLLDKRLANM